MRRPRAWISLLTVPVAVLAVPPSASAQCLEWRAGFDPQGTDGIVYALTTTAGGPGAALYAGGEFHAAGGAIAHRVARFDGASWSAVGAGGPNGTVSTLAWLDDGSGPALYASGSFWAVGPVLANHIARWDGATWSALGEGLDQDARAIALFDDGTGVALYAAGTFGTAGGASANRVARWDGSQWSPLGSGLGSSTAEWVEALAVFDDGTGPALYAAGIFTTAGGAGANRIARWDGSTWTPLGSGIEGSGSLVAVWSLAVFDDGSGPVLCAGGQFDTAGGVAASNVARWDGSAWSPVGAGLDGPVTGFAAFDDGAGPALHAVGGFAASGGNPATGVARWNGSSWSALASGVEFPSRASVVDFGAGLELYVAGSFAAAGDRPARNVARWDGSRWAPEPSSSAGVDAPVLAAAGFDDGTGTALVAGGRFTAAGDVVVNHVARWDGSTWSGLGGGTDGEVAALLEFDDGSGRALYAGGTFAVAGGASANNVARWDGSTWSALAGGVDGGVAALAAFDAGSGPALYAAGSFATASGAVVNHVARWTGVRWSALAGGLSGNAEALAVFDDGSGPALYAGGSFLSASGTSASRIARWDGSSWSAVGAGTNGEVSALAVSDVGGVPALFAGGTFTLAGGAPASFVARWDGSAWSALGAGTSTFVRALASFDDGSGPSLHAGGIFPFAGGRPVGHLARWDGASWWPLATGTDAEVLCLSVVDVGSAGSPDLYAGGRFARAGATPSWSLAAWLGCEHVGTRLCFGDGTGAPCPCGNAGGSGRGCDNSVHSGGAALGAGGTPSLAADTLWLSASGQRTSALSIFLQGDAQIAPVGYGDGLRCAGGALKRLFVRNAIAGTVWAPQPGDPSFSARSAALGDPLAAGAVRVYQVYSRDPDPAFCPDPLGSTFNASNALRIEWSP